MAVLVRATMLFLPLCFVASAGFPFPFGEDPPAFFEDPPVIDSGMFAPYDGENTRYLGSWELVTLNSGVSAMHLVIMPNNKALIFDTTVFGPSEMPLPAGRCRYDSHNKETHTDCWAHAVELDLDTGYLRPLEILTDTWCSSGSLDANGTLVQTGGYNDGGKAVRLFSPCDSCDWVEYPTSLSVQRWYATNQVLPDGGIIIVGGRRQFSYEFVPAIGKSNPSNYRLRLLVETTDEVEDNLYPFVFLSTDGNLFILANNRSILLDYVNHRVIKEFPVLPGSRNYPASAMAALLPIRLRSRNPKKIATGVLICGGSPTESAKLAAKGTFIPALDDCATLTITDPHPVWKFEKMPHPRVMGDMLLLPNTDILMINGAKNGTAGWDFAREPNLSPVIYRLGNPISSRFEVLKPSTIPRMYHSTSAVLPDGRILVAGSNSNYGYNFTNVLYPTEMRVEKFWPPYLDPLLEIKRPSILTQSTVNTVEYGQKFSVEFMLGGFDLSFKDLMVTMYAPPFTTHGVQMNQRLLVLRTRKLIRRAPATHAIGAVAPPSSVVAPPGYYMLFVVYQGVPSEGMWVRIH